MINIYIHVYWTFLQNSSWNFVNNCMRCMLLLSPLYRLKKLNLREFKWFPNVTEPRRQKTIEGLYFNITWSETQATWPRACFLKNKNKKQKPLIYLAVLGLTWGMRNLPWGTQAVLFSGVDIVVAACRLSCPVVCGILVLWQRIEPMSPALQRRFLTTKL